jgi:hypothetical protein
MEFCEHLAPLICMSLSSALQGVFDGAAGPSWSSDHHQKPSSRSGTTEAATLQRPEQRRQEEEEAKLSLELTLSFAYM